MPSLPHHHRMLAYDRWANQRVMDSLLSAREALERGPGGAAAEVPALIKAVQIWSHIQWARRLSLSRLGPTHPPELPGMFPSWPLQRAIDESKALDKLWHAYVDSLTAADLDRIQHYTTTEGKPVSNTIGDILAHLVNHSSYHRGQIARLVAECGGKVAATDFILFARAN